MTWVLHTIHKTGNLVYGDVQARNIRIYIDEAEQNYLAMVLFDFSLSKRIISPKGEDNTDYDGAGMDSAVSFFESTPTLPGYSTH
jgi:hypothetical protein